MIGFAISVGVLGLLVAAGMKKRVSSAKSDRDARRRFAELKGRKRVTLDEAEDAMVLARRFKDVETARRFSPVVSDLRRKRVSV